MFLLNLTFKPAGVSIQSGGNEPCTDYFGAKMGFSRVSGGHTCKRFLLFFFMFCLQISSLSWSFYLFSSLHVFANEAFFHGVGFA